MKKILICCILLLSYPGQYSFCQKKGDLDLPDIFVWGKDRSDLPGIGEQGSYFQPYLRKSNFIDELRIENPLSINPKYIFRNRISGLRLYGALGTFGDYLMGLNHSRYTRDSWFYNYGLKKNRHYLENTDPDHELMSGHISLGKYSNRWGWIGGAEGSGAESDFKKNIWRAGGECFFRAGKVSLNPQVSVKGASIEGKSAEETSMLLEAETALFPNHSIAAGFEIDALSIEDEDRKSIKLGFDYVNSVYRDFNVLLNLGYYPEEAETVFGGRITGCLAALGYTLYYTRRNINPDLYIMYDKYPYLKLPDMYAAELNRTLGLEATRHIGSGMYIGAGLSFSRVTDQLIFINAPGDIYPLNLEEEADVTCFSVKLKRGYLEVNHTRTGSSIDVPYLGSNTVLTLSPVLKIKEDRELELRLTVDLKEGFEIWHDESGTSRTEVDPFLLLDAEMTYALNDSFEFRIGARNLLGSKKYDKCGYYEKEPRVFMLICMGYGSKRENK
ncbi:MAG: hypothetical protein ABIH89_01730 [Elusimicrobiota bacterium]